MAHDIFNEIVKHAKNHKPYYFKYNQIKKPSELFDNYQRNKYYNTNKMKNILSPLSNQEGLEKAYKAPNYIYQDGSTLYIGGTQTARDVWDDLKIPFNKVDQSKRYQDANKIVENNILQKHPIQNIVGHSLGASVGLKLVDNHLQYPMKTTSYGAPIAIGSNQLVSPFISGNRYRHPYDPISMFDYGSKTIPIQDPNVLNPHDYHGYGDKDKM
jgi:hypothetical protein